jgi:triosephosphate isomerase
LALPKNSLVVNFKTYRQGTGEKAEELAKKLNMKGIVLAVQNTDIYRVSRKVHVPVFAQHVDPVDYGKFTGHANAAALKESGAVGVIINHSEDRVSIETIKKNIEICRKHGLASLVCISNPGMAERISRMKPDAIAIEPPELIGSGRSVSRAKPQVITKTVKKVRKSSRALCGAGITTKDDVKKAMQLGCHGILVSSAIVLSRNPRKLAKTFLDVM